ncbi:S41 family peptidase [Solibacillus sp. FSL K6-1523]|uniref:S41 family peptidase n=1 Tax=Solibacillus sp. FSL K6-1523 TaxID=2921471 RepID=UPI0030F9FE5A
MLKRQLSALLFFILFLTIPFTTLASPLDEAKQTVKDLYVGDIHGNVDKATSIEALIGMLDPYSAYFTEEEFEEYINAVDLTSVGIGVVIEKVNAGILITQLIDGGSAKKSGLVVGDIITTVDGTSTVSMTIEQASSLIKGKENTNVAVTILREDGTIMKMTLVRNAFSLPNVTTELLYGKVGYISLSSFSNDTASLISKAITSLKKQGAQSFILDLQNNGGGYVTAAEQLIGMFPNTKNAYKLQESTGISNVRALQQAVKFPANTKVLINKLSASSSEMTAAALLDQKAATLYGQKTYGKGSMQAFYELSDGGILKLTIGHFLGPANTIINNVGVKPNVVTTGNPLFRAHYDAITSNLTNYKEHTGQKSVSATKPFTVNFTKPVADKINTSSVELVELGGQVIQATITMQQNKLLVTPVQPLDDEKDYALIVHPKVKNNKGKTLQQGIYLPIQVTK